MEKSTPPNAQQIITTLVAIIATLITVLAMNGWIGSRVTRHEISAEKYIEKINRNEKEITNIRTQLDRIEEKIDHINENNDN